MKYKVEFYDSEGESLGPELTVKAVSSKHAEEIAFAQLSQYLQEQVTANSVCWTERVRTKAIE